MDPLQRRLQKLQSETTIAAR